MTTDERLRVMLAESAIKDVQLRYCRGIDRFDWDLIEGCFHPDAIHDLGPFKVRLQSSFRGRQNCCPSTNPRPI